MSLTFEGVDVVASCDHSVSFSSVTAQLLTRRLRRSNIVPDVRIRALVFITDGVINLSTDFLFLVVDDACSDVVFGRDWLEYCWNISDNHRDVQLPEHPCCFVCSDNNGLNYGSSMPVKVYTPGFKSADSVKGEYLVRDMLFSASTTDATQLLPLLRNHGLENDFSPEQMNIQVLRHLLSGVCIHAGAGRTGPKACRLICRAFSDVHSLLGYIVREVSLSLPSVLSIASLKDIVGAAGEQNSLIHVNRADLIRLLFLRCVKSSEDDVLFKELFLGFETLSHSSLHAYATLHGIQFQSADSREALLQMLMQHLSDGSCLRGKDIYDIFG